MPVSALTRARELLRIYDNGTHISPPELIGVLRQLVDDTMDDTVEPRKTWHTLAEGKDPVFPLS